MASNHNCVHSRIQTFAARGSLFSPATKLPTVGTHIQTKEINKSTSNAPANVGLTRRSTLSSYPGAKLPCLFFLSRTASDLEPQPEATRVDSTTTSSHGDRATTEHSAVDQMLRLWIRDPDLCYGRARVPNTTKGGRASPEAYIASHITFDREAAKPATAHEARTEQAAYKTGQGSAASHRSGCSQ